VPNKHERDHVGKGTFLIKSVEFALKIIGIVHKGRIFIHTNAQEGTERDECDTNNATAKFNQGFKLLFGSLLFVQNVLFQKEEEICWSLMMIITESWPERSDTT